MLKSHALSVRSILDTFRLGSCNGLFATFLWYLIGFFNRCGRLLQECLAGSELIRW